MVVQLLLCLERYRQVNVATLPIEKEATSITEAPICMVEPTQKVKVRSKMPRLTNLPWHNLENAILSSTLAAFNS